MVRKRKRKIRYDRIILFLAMVVFLLVGLCWFIHSLVSDSKTPEVVEATPTPDPRYLNDYDWSNLIVDGQVYRYESDTYTSSFGIDVSFHQDVIDWAKVKEAGVEFAFVRVGYRGYQSGILNEDAQFRANMQGASEVGIDLGVYFFSSAITVEEAKEEAGYVLNAIQAYGVKLPIVYDMENVSENDRIRVLDVRKRTDIALAFCQTIQEAGYQPMVYGSASWLSQMLYMQDIQDLYPFWVAAYHETIQEPEFPFVFEIWQYDNRGILDGIDKEVDLNIWIQKKTDQ